MWRKSLFFVLVTLSTFAAGEKAVTLGDVLDSLRANRDQVTAVSATSVTTIKYEEKGIDVWKTNESRLLSRQKLSEEDIARRVEGRWKGVDRTEHTLYLFETDGTRFRGARRTLERPEDAAMNAGEFDVVTTFNGTTVKTYSKRMRAGSQGPERVKWTPPSKEHSLFFEYVMDIEEGLQNLRLTEEELQTPLTGDRFVITREYHPELHREYPPELLKRAPLSSTTIVVVDLEHGMLPVAIQNKAEYTDSEGKRFSKEGFALEAKLDEVRGVVFPTECIVRKYVLEDAPGEIIRDPKKRVQWVIEERRRELLSTITSRSLSIDFAPQFPEGHFEIEFPQGTTISQFPEGTTVYVSPPDFRHR